MKFYGKTDVGLVRTDNQDSFGAEMLADGNVIVAVCDGMGGVSGGNVASEVAVKAIVEDFKKNSDNLSDEDDIVIASQQAINIANTIVYEISNREQQLSGMGTTVVFAYVTGSMAHILHAGDSRAYHISKSGAVQITNDHSFVQEMVDLGRISKEEAKNHPKKNIITRALGINSILAAEYSKHDVSEGDYILICTDGLSNLVEDDEMKNIVLKYGAEKACDVLIETAKKRGGFDNITVVIVSC